jgi:hypothetical protein
VAKRQTQIALKNLNSVQNANQYLDDSIHPKSAESKFGSKPSSKHSKAERVKSLEPTPNYEKIAVGSNNLVASTNATTFNDTAQGLTTQVKFRL